jgi:solute carrier family 35 protein C2
MEADGAQYNKWMFQQENGESAATNVFPFPLFTTSVHMVVQFCLSTLVLYFVPRFRPTADPHDAAFAHRPASPVVERGERRRWWLWDPKKPVMTRWFYLTRIGPCGAATGLDIGLGNMSFRFITLTFYSTSLPSLYA